jgi:hypothetical protein
VWGPAGVETRGDILEPMARIAPSLPNEAMARIASGEQQIKLNPS